MRDALIALTSSNIVLLGMVLSFGLALLLGLWIGVRTWRSDAFCVSIKILGLGLTLRLGAAAVREGSQQDKH